MSSDMGWSQRIKLAIENDSFSLYSQPVISLKSGNILSREVLLRLTDQDEKPIMPSGFLPSAERFGLSADLDQWVISKSFRTLKNQPIKYASGFSINLSAQTIDNENTLQFIENQMCRYEINPEKIIFELTESSAINQLGRAVRFIESLHKLGFKTALDDFGSGYSSFSYLKDLPVDYVKLDGAFVQNLGNDKVKIAIVKAMNEVAHVLGIKTVAEFVEDAKTLVVLREIGVDYCQGYHTGKPVSIDEKGDNIHYLSDAV